MEKPRKKRGINKVEDLPIGESVRFNSHGAAVGEHRHKFVKYMGNAVRKNISILEGNWQKIDPKEKNVLWSDIKVYLRLLAAFSFD